MQADRVLATLLTLPDRDQRTPIRVAIALMILGGIFGWLVGIGASPWFLLVLPFIAVGAISANRLT